MAAEPSSGKPEASGSSGKSGMGCGGWLGLLILILAAAAVVFYWVVKPKLEERGVDVDTKLETLSAEARAAGQKAAEAVKTGYEKVRSETPTTLDGAKDKAQSGYEAAKTGASETAAQVSDTAGQGMDKAKSWY